MEPLVLVVGESNIFGRIVEGKGVEGRGQVTIHDYNKKFIQNFVR